MSQSDKRKKEVYLKIDVEQAKEKVNVEFSSIKKSKIMHQFKHKNKKLCE